jgi:hypothetical protein
LPTDLFVLLARPSIPPFRWGRDLLQTIHEIKIRLDSLYQRSVCRQGDSTSKVLFRRLQESPTILPGTAFSLRGQGSSLSGQAALFRQTYQRIAANSENPWIVLEVGVFIKLSVQEC